VHRARSVDGNESHRAPRRQKNLQHVPRAYRARVSIHLG
jgi:hypothetical protein